MAIMQNGKIVLDPIMMRQYSMTLNMMNEESDKISELKKELEEFKSIETIEEARKRIYEKFPKFKENTSFANMGVKYMLHDTEENVRFLAWFTDEIICFDYV